MGATDDQIAVAPLPSVDDSSEMGTSFVGGGNLAVFKESDNRDAAWKLVQWLSEADVQTEWYETMSDLPAVEASWDTGPLAEDPLLSVFGEQLEVDQLAAARAHLGAGRRGHRPQHRAGRQRQDVGRGRHGRHAEPGAVDRHRSVSQLATTGAAAAEAVAGARPPGRSGAASLRPASLRRPDPARQARAAWLLAAPFVLLFAVFTVGPVLASLGMSFTDIRITDLRSPLAVEFTGLENYTNLLVGPGVPQGRRATPRCTSCSVSR